MPNMAIPPRRWVGYALLAAGLSLLFDTVTFLLTNWFPLRVPMYAANELALGCVLTVAGVLILLAPTLKRTLLRIRIGVALILIAASIYGGWQPERGFHSTCQCPFHRDTFALPSSRSISMPGSGSLSRSRPGSMTKASRALPAIRLTTVALHSD
jgi:hypothetical protein